MMRRDVRSVSRSGLLVLLLLAVSIIAVYAYVKHAGARAQREFQLYENLFAAKRYDRLIQELPGFLERYPKFDKRGKGYFFLAVAYQERGNYSEALRAWSEALRSTDDPAVVHRIYYGMGICYSKLGKADEAIRAFKSCYEAMPEGEFAPEALYNLGFLYGKKGDLKGAIESFKALLEKFPNDPQAQEAARTLGDLNLKYILRATSMQYKVRRGDSLAIIARRFNSTPEMIMKASGLKSSIIRVGQVLNVPRPKFVIEIDLSDKLLFLKYKGLIVKKYPVGIGAPETPTPTGDFVIRNKIVNPTWYSPEGPIPPGDPRNLLGTRWMGISSDKIPLSRGYGIHGTSEPETIGKAESDGCIRMFNEDVEELFGLVTIGTPVIIRERITDRRWFTPEI